MVEATINSVTAEPLNFELDEPFEIASGKKKKIENVFVKLTLENGIEGYGEASPLEPINGENQETVVASVDSLSDFLVGKDVKKFNKIAETLKSILWAQTSARTAIEMAILDALTKYKNISIWDYYGGAEDKIYTDYTISIVNPDKAYEQAKNLTNQGFNILKAKVGKGGQEDLERLKAISEGAPNCELNIDANEGFAPKEAVEFARELEDSDVSLNLFEQPVKRENLKGLREVTSKLDQPVAADESVFFVEDAERIIDMGAADVINIKLMKSGLKEGQEIAQRCKENGMDLMVGCMLESMLGMTASVLFASGIGGFSHIDLDPRSEVFSAPFQGGVELNSDKYEGIDQARPGLGINYDPGQEIA